MPEGMPEGMKETEVRPGGPRRVELSALTFRPRAIAARGALDESFRQDLYRVPFGRGFYDGFVATSGELPVDEGAPFVVEGPAPRAPRHLLAVGYLLSGAPGDAGLSHGVALRYGYGVHRFVELGLLGEVGRAQRGDVALGGSDETRGALMGVLGVRLPPLARLRFGLEAALGWQLVSGTAQIGGVRVTGTEARGLRLEASGSLAIDLVRPLALFARGGLAVDGLYPRLTPAATQATGFLDLGVQFRL
jgi:hypothetical protein